MASSGSRTVILAIILTSLCCQASALPLLVRILLEPGLIDVRIRAAAVLNKAGLGVGGFLSKSGELIHWVLSEIGTDINKSLNKIAKLFTNPNENVDDESGLKVMRKKLEEREKERKREEAEGEHDKEKERQEIIEKGKPSKFQEHGKRSSHIMKFF